jgi:hypothetical protein
MGGRRLGLIEFACDLARALSLLVLCLDLEHEFVASTCRPLRRASSAGSYSRGSRTSTGSPSPEGRILNATTSDTASSGSPSAAQR